MISSACFDLSFGEVAEIPQRFKGKPVYALLLDFSQLPASGEKSVAHGLADMDEFGIDYTRSWVEHASGIRYGLDHPNTSDASYWRTRIDETAVTISVGRDRSQYSATVCIWFTKDSDNAGACLPEAPAHGYRVGEFKSWFEQCPPEGWAVRDGSLLANAREDYPELWTFLTGEGAWRCVSEAEWQAQSQEDPWNGVGGVAWFALDACAETIRLPDTRGMYAEDAGFDGLDVGGVHGDAIRNITGRFNGAVLGASGVFNETSMPRTYGSGNNVRSYMDFDASLVVPTANKNQPRAFGLLPCVYVGRKI